MTLLAFLGAMGLLITVHEWGHYRMAVACGVRVLTFSVGFGKPLLRWQSRKPIMGHATVFMICLIPLGGFVKMLDERDGDVPLGDVSLAFNRQALYKRAAVVAAGPLANILLAFFLYSASFCIGQDESKPILASPQINSVAQSLGLRAGDTILRAGLSEGALHDVKSMESLRWWALRQNFDQDALVLEVLSGNTHRIQTVLLTAPEFQNEGSQSLKGLELFGLGQAWSAAVIAGTQTGRPAQRDGLMAGDLVVSVDGQPIEDAKQLRELIRTAARVKAFEPQTWEVQHNGQQRLTLQVQPDRVLEQGQYIGQIGAYIGAHAARVWVQANLLEGLALGWARTRDVMTLTLDMLGRMLAGRASLEHLSGPLAVAEYAGQSASLGLTAYVSYLALLSLSLGVFNLMPLPVLDGGHLLYYLYEALTGRPPATQWIQALQQVGLLMLLALMAFSFFNDLVRLGWLR